MNYPHTLHNLWPFDSLLQICPRPIGPLDGGSIFRQAPAELEMARSYFASYLMDTYLVRPADRPDWQAFLAR